MSKKKKTFLIALTMLLFFGALMFSLRQPLSETRANTAAQNKLATADNKAGASDESKLDKQKVGEQEKDPEVATTETSETEVKLDANTVANNGGSSTTSSNNSNKSDNGNKSSSSSTSSGSSGSSSGGTSSGGSGSSGSTTPTKPSETKPAPPAPKPPTPAPALKPFSVPTSSSFAFVEKGTNSDKAELLIGLNSADNYETQLNQLYNVIAPVAGSSIANEIVSYARTKTDAYISLDRSWSVSGRTLELGSTWGDWTVSFYSWRK